MKKTEFLQMVLQEADHLREHATDEEKGKLDFSQLEVSHYTMCIYGQMTGSCYSSRAFTLYSKLLDGESVDKSGYTFSVLNEKGNFKLNNPRCTPIEVYITMKGAKNESLISYIKGEINDWKP